MKNLRKLILILAGILLILGACNKGKNNKTSETPCDNTVDTLTCIEKKINIEKEYCLDSVYECIHNDSIVYLFINKSICIDASNDVYDKNCTFLCSPTGGMTGPGDCPNFLNEITDKKLIWAR